MKRLALIVILAIVVIAFATSCGQEKTSSPNISYTDILWQGYPTDAPYSIGSYQCDFKNQFINTMDCLQKLNIQKEGQPYILVVKNISSCGGEPAGGCYVLAEQRIYISEGALTWVLPHEAIHWATNSGNSLHGSAYFTQCQGY